MKKSLYPVLLALLCFSLQSCFVFGIHQHVSWKTNDAYKRLYKHYNIKNEQELHLDTLYDVSMKKLYANEQQMRHDHLQPVEYMIFNKQGQMVCFDVNCYVHINLLLCGQWNHEKLFDKYPAGSMCKVDSLMTLQQLNGLVLDNNDKPINIDATNYDYVQVVFFNTVLYRVSKELIRTLHHQDYHGYKVKTLYINSDNNLLWSAADSTNKEMVRRKLKQMKGHQQS